MSFAFEANLKITYQNDAKDNRVICKHLYNLKFIFCDGKIKDILVLQHAISYA